MKKILIGAALGLGVAIVAYKLAESDKVEKVHDDVDKLVGKAKKRIKDEIDQGVNQLEYLKDRAAFKTEHINKLAEQIENRILEKLGKAKS